MELIFEDTEEIKPSIYDTRTMRSSFYDGVKFVDERCGGQSKLHKKMDLERIMRESHRDDWDD